MKKLLALLFIIPFILSATAEQRYFLHDDMNPEHPDMRLMDTMEPKYSYSSYINLDEGYAIWATSPFSKETKIDGDVYITIFIEASFIKSEILPFQMRVIKASLIDVAPSGNIDTIASSRPSYILFLKNDTVKPENFRFDNIEYVIPAGHCLGLKVEKVLDLLSYFPFSVLSPFFATNVLYDSTFAKSYVSVPFNVSGGIELKCYQNEKEVKPGEDVVYYLTIKNGSPQNDVVTISSNYAGNGWKVSIDPTTLQVKAKSQNYSYVTVTAPENAQEGDFLNITITAQGGAGSASIWLNTSIAALSYGVEVVAKDDEKEGKVGDNVTFVFTVTNTGDLPDTYELSVAYKWDYYIEEEQISLEAGESKDVNVIVSIPINAQENYTTVGLTASSTNSDVEDSDWSTLKIVLAAGEEEGGWNIGYALFVAGVVALLLIAYYLGRTAQRVVSLSCEERMAEVAPGEKAIFSVEVKNPLEKDKKGKNKIKYRFNVEGKLPENWHAEIDREEIVLDGGEEDEIKVTVHVPKDASPEEWASIDLVASPSKGKSEKINLLLTLREPMPILETEIKHEPEEFKEGEKVITKVKIENVGEKEAEDKKVIVIVNGKEKNRVEGIKIPPNTSVEIEIPWIAEEENNVEVKVE